MAPAIAAAPAHGALAPAHEIVPPVEKAREIIVISDDEDELPSKRLDKHDQAFVRLRQQHRRLRTEIMDVVDETDTHIREVAEDLLEAMQHLRNRVNALEDLVDQQTQALRQLATTLHDLTGMLAERDGDAAARQ